MFYVDNVIKFSVFLELLWKFTLLVRYKLNLFQPLQVNQFDIFALLLDYYSRFTRLYKMFLYRYWKPAFWMLIDTTVSFGMFPVVL